MRCDADREDGEVVSLTVSEKLRQETEGLRRGEQSVSERCGAAGLLIARRALGMALGSTCYSWLTLPLTSPAARSNKFTSARVRDLISEPRSRVRL